MHSILIVEDDMNINGLLKEALEKADYLCTQAFSGTEARMLLAMNRYSGKRCCRRSESREILRLLF